MRAHMSPLQNWDTYKVISKDGIGTNMGNMVFLNSIMRTLMTEDTQIDTINTHKTITLQQIIAINQEYDCIVLPFANAFRKSFMEELQNITFLITYATIPCIVVGVGVEATFKNPLKEENEFDETVRNFIDSVLEKSTIIGTRGRYTSDYLNKLGYQEGKDHMVIGCPSMYYWGEELPKIKKKKLTKNSKVSINWKIDLPHEVNDFIYNNTKCFKKLHYVPQVLNEIKLMYYGIPLPKTYKNIYSRYPSSANYPWYKDNKAQSFVNLPTWFHYLKKKDFSFGSRIHGNIAALLSGTPGYVIVTDYRILELVEFHHIPHIKYQDLKKEDTIFSLYEKADYSYLYEGHKERFQNYLQFLERNGLDHIYASNKKYSKKNPCPFDREMSKLKLQPPLLPISAASYLEKQRRVHELRKKRGIKKVLLIKRIARKTKRILKRK